MRKEHWKWVENQNLTDVKANSLISSDRNNLNSTWNTNFQIQNIFKNTFVHIKMHKSLELLCLS